MRGTKASQNKVKAILNKIEAIQTLQREKEVERELYLKRVAQLDEEISCCAQSINEQLPIMSLPAEILLSIFKLAVDFKTLCSTVSEPDEDPHYCHTPWTSTTTVSAVAKPNSTYHRFAMSGEHSLRLFRIVDDLQLHRRRMEFL